LYARASLHIQMNQATRCSN